MLYWNKDEDMIEIVFDGHINEVPEDFYKKLCNGEISAHLFFSSGKFLGVNFVHVDGCVSDGDCSCKCNLGHVTKN